MIPHSRSVLQMKKNPEYGSLFLNGVQESTGHVDNFQDRGTLQGKSIRE